MLRNFSFAILGTVLAANVAAAKSGSEPAPALPASAELKAWYSLAECVERGFESGDRRFTFEMKKAHVYPKVLRDGKIVGAFRSESASTNVEGEIATFNISRALGCSDFFQPATGMEMRGAGLATLKQLMKTVPFPPIKEPDRAQVLAEIEGNPEALTGVFKQALPMRAVKYHSIERADVPPNGVMNEADPIARHLKNYAPQPGAELMTPPNVGGRAPTVTLARELSDILLVDALAGQWDRFSGGNLHMLVVAGTARFIAVDNGGAGYDGDHGNLEQFKRTVTRFDRRVAARLFALEDFLDKGGDFLGFRDEHALGRALKIDEGRHWEVFKDRVRQVAAHIRACGDGSFFRE